MKRQGECKYCGKLGIEGEVCNECIEEDKKEKDRNYIR